MLELGNSLTALAAEDFITSCNDRNALTRIQNMIDLFYKLVLLSFHIILHLFGHLSLSLAENLGPQRKLEFLDFPRITEIDGVKFGSHIPRRIIHKSE